MTTETSTWDSWNPFVQLKRLYDWTLKWADHHLNTKILGFFSTIESIFFPVPVDPLLIAMGVANPRRSFYYAFITTVGSVIGAALGYWIGAAFWLTTKDFFFAYVFSPEIFEAVKLQFQEHDVLAVLLASFTPIPFKVCTITAGVAELSFSTFLISALAGRGARFFLLGGMVFFFGEKIKVFIDRYFNALAIVFGVLGVLGYYLIPKILH